MLAEKLGAQMIVGQKVVKIRCDQWPYALTLENIAVIETRSIVIATGLGGKRLSHASLSIPAFHQDEA